MSQVDTANKQDVLQSYEEAERFIAAIAGGTDIQMVFQTFDDSKEGRPIAKILKGTIGSEWAEILALNKKGAGVFVQINEGVDRGNRYIKKPRASFVDSDTGNLPVELPLVPSILVNSKNGQHAYWLLGDGEDIGEFTATQLYLASALGTDPAIKDNSRVMRLPGTLHLKNPEEPHLVTCTVNHTDKYSFEQIKQKMKMPNKIKKQYVSKLEKVKQIAKELSVNAGTRHSTVKDFIGESLRGGIELWDLGNILETYCKRCDFDLNEANEILESMAKSFIPKPNHNERIAKQIVFKSLDEVAAMDLPDIEYIVEDVLVVGGVSILCGKAKAGKSTWSRQLEKCVAEGSEFLGRKTQKTPVLIVTIEDRLKEVLNHFNLLGAEKNNIYVCDLDLKGKDDIVHVENQIKKVGAGLLIVDPLIRGFELREINDYTKTYEDITPIVELAKRTNTHILLTHHLGKGTDRDDQDSMLGSTALGAVVETMIFIKRDGAKRLFSSRPRYGTQIEDESLEFEAETKSFTSIGMPEVCNDISKNEQLKNEIRNILKASQTEKALIKSKLGVRPELTIKLLKELETSGEIFFTGQGQRGDPIIYHLGNAEQGIDSNVKADQSDSEDWD